MQIRERYHEVLELKQAEVAPDYWRRLRFSYRRFVNFLEDRNITQSERITLRHVLDFMNTWKNYADITRKLETEKLKLFLLEARRPGERNQNSPAHQARRRAAEAEALHRRRGAEIPRGGRSCYLAVLRDINQGGRGSF